MNKPDTAGFRSRGRRPALAGGEPRRAAREIRQGRGARPRRPGDGARGAAARRAGAGRRSRPSPAVWEPVFLKALEDGLHPRRADQLGGRVAGIARRHADQLLRATGGRFGLRDGRRQARHLHRAARGGRDHAARRRGRLRLLRDPAARRAGARHRQRGLGADQLHARLRPVLRHGRERRARGAARRWACCAATIPTSWSSSAPSGRPGGSTTSTSRSASPTR